MDKLKIQRENTLDPHEFIDVLKRSTLAERRPVNQPEIIAAMCQHADIIITARLKNQLIGIARSVSDFKYCTYLSDLAVDIKYQKQGIGKKLIAATKQESPEALLILLSAPKAVDYYPRIGMVRHPHCFLLRELEQLENK